MVDTLFSRGLKFGAFAMLLMITGCAEYNRRVLQDMPDIGWEFNQALSKEYEVLGNIEQDVMYDEGSAGWYYERAILSKEGRCVAPTRLEYWDIEPDKLPELEKAHDHLMYLLSMGARQIAPKMTARAQSHFDCWVEQQSEGWQHSDIAWCRSEFYKAISDVELKLMGGVHKVMPKSMVLFGKNSAELTPEAMKVIEDVAHRERTQHQRLLLIGRTDKVGDLKHNKELSRQRAMTVKKALVHDGVPVHLISIKAEGETAGPEVDAHNRRVDILFLDHK